MMETSTSPTPPVRKVGNSWVLTVKDDHPDPTTLVGHPWKKLSTVIIRFSPQFDSPDPVVAPFVNCANAESRMNWITNRAVAISALLKRDLQGSVEAGTMAIQVEFAEAFFRRRVHTGNIYAGPWWNLKGLATIMSAFHWIEPEQIHARAASAMGTTALTPPFLLPTMGVA
jgi:hypothetical protein